jgi:hypothetical protein
MRYFKYIGRLFREIGGYAMEHKVWWLIPLVLLLVVISLFILVGQGVTLPFVYTLF